MQEVIARDSSFRIEKKFTVLFQGDSITDGNRGRNEDPNHILGHGYAFSIASTLGSMYPDRNLTFINRGISGDKISSLQDRWEKDTISIKPELISILAGVNDILASISEGSALNAEIFEKQFKELLTITRSKLPAAIIVLGEPFILPVGMVQSSPELWKASIESSRAVVRKLADEYKAVFVPYQEMFTKACQKAPAQYWIWDGIHPTYSGHGLMTRLWLDTVGKKCKQLRLG